MSVALFRDIGEASGYDQWKGNNSRRNRMNALNQADSQKRPPRWLGPAKFLFLLCFVAGCLLLVQEMVHHHFFSGGALNYRSTSHPGEG